MPKNLTDTPSLLEHEWIATFATVDEQGKPHAVPVWFAHDDGKLHIQTDRCSVKVHNVQSNPYAAMAICAYRAKRNW